MCSDTYVQEVVHQKDVVMHDTGGMDSEVVASSIQVMNYIQIVNLMTRGSKAYNQVLQAVIMDAHGDRKHIKTCRA